MPNLSSVARSAYSDLLRLLKDEAVAGLRGVTRSKVVDGKTYWYATEKIGTQMKWRYIGPNTEEVRARVVHLDQLRATSKERQVERRRLVRILRAEGMTPVDRATGSLLLAMNRVGVFRLGGTLVGTNAFRMMEGDLGVTLPLDGAANTGDVDIAQFERLSLAIGDTVETPLADTFKDLKFEPNPALDRDSVWRWRQGGQTGMMVEFLTPSFELEEGIKPLPALGVKARGLHHLNYLIANPIPAIALYRDGLLVQVPRPERFAIHKLIVADRRRDGANSAKAYKDREQARFLIETLAEERPFDVWDAYKDALGRGPKWVRRIEVTLERMPELRRVLEECDG